MTQPYDYWHVPGGSGLTIEFQGREWTSPAQQFGTCGWQMLTARPFFVGDSGIRLAGVGLRLSAATYTGTCRVGIYACPPPSDHNMYPSTLVADLGAVDLNGSLNRYIAAASPIELTPGFWYVATRPTAGAASFPAVWAYHGEGGVGGPGYPLGYDPTTGVGYIGFSAYDSSAGALPASFPAISPRNYGVIQANLNPPPAIYIEHEATSGVTQVQWIYNGAAAPGSAVVSTDTVALVAVTYGPNTPVSTVAAAFESAANIRRAVNVGTATNMPNVGSALFLLQAGGPLQARASGAADYFPATAIEVVS